MQLPRNNVDYDFFKLQKIYFDKHYKNQTKISVINHTTNSQSKGIFDMGPESNMRRV
jgi:hypothetical protein